MDNSLFLDTDQRFMKPDFYNSSVSSISSVIKKLDLIAPPTLQAKGNKFVEELWKERGKQNRIQNLVLIIADSLGTANIRETGILNDYLDKNIEVDASFPTMTSTNMASLSHAQFPSTHGLVGYNIYHEKLHGLYNALNCQTVSNGQDVPIDKLKLTKQDIIAGENVFNLLNNQANICMQDFYYELWVPDIFPMQGLPQYLFGKTTPTFSYETYDPKRMLQELYHHLFNSRSLNVIGIYFPHTDMTSHLYTAQSKEYLISLKLLESIIKGLERHPTVNMGETAIVVTSDHGQVTLPTGSQNVKVSQSDVKTHREKGFSIGTSGRTLHVYYGDERGQRNAEDYLAQYFNNERNGIILTQEEALKLLGPDKPSENYLQRLGQKVILIDENFYLDYPEVVTYGEEKELRAQHGGLSKRELKVPFLLI